MRGVHFAETVGNLHLKAKQMLSFTVNFLSTDALIGETINNLRE